MEVGKKEHVSMKIIWNEIINYHMNVTHKNNRFRNGRSSGRMYYIIVRLQFVSAFLRNNNRSIKANNVLCVVYTRYA